MYNTSKLCKVTKKLLDLACADRFPFNITKDNTVIVTEGNKTAIQARCELLRRQIARTESEYNRENDRSVWLNLLVK